VIDIWSKKALSSKISEEWSKVAVFIPPITPAIAIADFSSAMTRVLLVRETVWPFNSSSFSSFCADLTSMSPLIFF